MPGIGAFSGASAQATPGNAPTLVRSLRNYSPYGANDNAHSMTQPSSSNSFIAFAVTAAQLVLADKQLSIAQEYYEINKHDYDFEANLYGGFIITNGNGVNIPGPMTKHKEQAFNAPFYAVDYPVYVGGSLTRTKIFDNKWFQTRRRLHRYGVGHQRHVDYQFYMERYRGSVSGFVMGRRVEDARKDWKDDQIQTHKVQALNYGLTAGNIAKQGLASSTGTLMGALDNASTRIGRVGDEYMTRASEQSRMDKAMKQLDDRSENGSDMGNRV